MTTENKVIGKRLAAIRKSRGLQQIPFSNEIGVSQSAYKNYERGASAVPTTLMAKLCKDYHISPAWFLLGEGPMTKEAHEKALQAAILKAHLWEEECGLKVDLKQHAKLVAKMYAEIVEKVIG